jgi:peptide/nickel transport system permease protein
MNSDPESFRKALFNAEQELKRGARQAARGWALQAVVLDPDSEEPWLFLAAVASPRASIKYLEQALKINPDSLYAQKGMQWATERLMREQAEPSLRQATPPSPNLEENPRSSLTAPEVSGVPAASEPKTRPHVQKVTAQIPVLSAQGMASQISRPVSRYRWSRNMMRLSSRWQNWIGFLLVSFFILVALFAPLISPNNPKSPGPFMKVGHLASADRQPRAPSLAAPLGSLPGQYDVLHALVWGTRDALTFGLEIALLSGILGVLFGAIAGYAGGIVNSILMRITDAFSAFPIIAGIVLLNQLWVSATVAAGGFFDAYHNVWVQGAGGLASAIQTLLQNVNPLVLILILFSWMSHARVTNAIVLSLKQAEFIQAARAIGAKPSRIILRHLLPNSIAPSIVMAARDVGSMVILQATFTFINLGGSSTWGEVLVMGKDWVLGPGGGILTYWWVYIPATLVLILFGIGWNLFGDGLGELLDPRDD